MEKHEPHTTEDFLREEQKYTVSQTTLDVVKDAVETIGQGATGIAIPKSSSWIERQTHVEASFSTDDQPKPRWYEQQPGDGFGHFGPYGQKPKPDWRMGLGVTIDRREGN